MASIKLVFSDTNKLFGLYRSFSKGSTLEHSELLFHCRESQIQIIISNYVLAELADICQRKHLNRSEDLQRQFLNITGFEVFETHDPSDRYDDFVIDSDDAQILQDAVESGAGYILTNNTKDFHIKKIYDTFHVLVIDDISQAIE